VQELGTQAHLEEDLVALEAVPEEAIQTEDQPQLEVVTTAHNQEELVGEEILEEEVVQ